MIAADIMTKSVICVRRSTPVSQIAALLFKNEISAVPVIDDNGHVVEVVSEDDLLRRRAAKRGASWWLMPLDLGNDAPRAGIDRARCAIAVRASISRSPNLFSR